MQKETKQNLGGGGSQTVTPHLIVSAYTIPSLPFLPALFASFTRLTLRNRRPQQKLRFICFKINTYYAYYTFDFVFQNTASFPSLNQERCFKILTKKKSSVHSQLLRNEENHTDSPNSTNINLFRHQSDLHKGNFLIC